MASPTVTELFTLYQRTMDGRSGRLLDTVPLLPSSPKYAVALVLCGMSDYAATGPEAREALPTHQTTSPQRKLDPVRTTIGSASVSTGRQRSPVSRRTLNGYGPPSRTYLVAKALAAAPSRPPFLRKILQNSAPARFAPCEPTLLTFLLRSFLPTPTSSRS